MKMRFCQKDAPAHFRAYLAATKERFLPVKYSFPFAKERIFPIKDTKKRGRFFALCSRFVANFKVRYAVFASNLSVYKKFFLAHGDI